MQDDLPPAPAAPPAAPPAASPAAPPVRRPFAAGRFDDPAIEALRRVGVVDVGSNSIRMVVFDGAARSPAYFYNEKVMAALGKGLAGSGRLNPEGRVRALAALRRFALLAEDWNVASLHVVATAAVREAADGPDFREEVLRETGLAMRVVDGAEEARLAAQGVLLGWPGAEGIVVDIGGSSMELARVGAGKVGMRTTTPLGPFRQMQVPGGPEARRRHAAELLRPLRDRFRTRGARLYLVGGAWRAIARMDMERRAYPLTVLHEYRMPPDGVLETVEWIARSDPATLRARTGTSAERMELLPYACEVLGELVRTLRPAGIDVSGYGIREGLLYEAMPDALRARDPLIEAARVAEATQARVPGFGRKLFAFLLPLFPGATEDRLRLIEAACLLHDTSWRAHPDYRAEICFESATRANLGGLDHAGRVFLGLALMHRYRNSRSGMRFETLLRLLDEDRLREAEVLGKAMRFGAMFAVGEPEDAGALVLAPRRGTLTLTLALTPRGRALYGEVAAARFEALAAALQAQPLLADA